MIIMFFIKSTLICQTLFNSCCFDFQWLQGRASRACLLSLLTAPHALFTCHMMDVRVMVKLPRETDSVKLDTLCSSDKFAAWGRHTKMLQGLYGGTDFLSPSFSSLFWTVPHGLWDLSFLTKDCAWTLSNEGTKSQPLGCQGIPLPLVALQGIFSYLVSTLGRD